MWGVFSLPSSLIPPTTEPLSRAGEESGRTRLAATDKASCTGESEVSRLLPEEGGSVAAEVHLLAPPSVGEQRRATPGESWGRERGSGSGEGGSEADDRQRREKSTPPAAVAKQQRQGSLIHMDPNWIDMFRAAASSSRSQSAAELEILGSMFSNSTSQSAPSAYTYPFVFGQPSVRPPLVGTSDNPLCVGEGSGTQSDGTEKDIGTEGKTGSKPKQTNFMPDEDKVLVSCWLNISTHPIISTGQRKESFWKKIVAEYNKLKNPGHPTRSKRSLENRWTFISRQVSNFQGYYEQVAEAIATFNKLEPRPFAVIHCWEILKNQAKWLDLQDTNRTQGNGLQDEDAFEDCEENSPSVGQSTDVSKTAEGNGLKRPPGREAAKATKKKANTGSYSNTSADVIGKMSDLAMQKMNMFHTQSTQTIEKIDKLVVIEEKKVVIEEKKMEIQQKLDLKREEGEKD